MTGIAGPVLLDTNVVIELIRGRSTGQRLDDQYRLRVRPDRPLISIVTIGEARALARRLTWGESKAAALESLLRELVVLDISHGRVLERYAEMRATLVREGRTVGDNDVWIAACTAAANATLLTTDRDFEPLAGRFIRLERFDPRVH